MSISDTTPAGPSYTQIVWPRNTSEAACLIERLQPLEDIDLRLRLADLSEIAENFASRRETIAILQENDMGKQCHCPSRQPPRPEDRVGKTHKLLMEW